MLRKSSKKKFNFYEEYKVLGTTFDYNNYFKNNLFFDYWLRYTLKKLIINPIDIFYSKNLESIQIFILVNKRYLLMNHELVNISNNMGFNTGFFRIKYLTIFRWLKSNRFLNYNKKKNKLIFQEKKINLKKYFFNIIFYKNNLRIFYLFYLDFLYKYLLYFFKFNMYLYLKNLNSTSFNFFYFLKNKLNIFYYLNFFFKYLNLLKSFIKLLKTRLLFNIFNFNKNKKITIKYFLLKLNYIRWYALKVYIMNKISKTLKYPIQLYFLNFNDFNFVLNNKLKNSYLSEEGISNKKLQNVLNNISIKQLKFFKYFLLNNIIIKVYLKLLSTFKIVYFFFFNNKNINNFTMVLDLKKYLYFEYIIKKFLYLNLNKYLKAVLIKFIKFQIKLKNIYYYSYNLNILYEVYKNIYWNKNLKNFYRDLKKNCIYYTVNEKFFKKMVLSLFFSLVLENPTIFANTLSEGFARTRKHHFFFNNIEDIINIAFKFIRKYKKIDLKSITVKVRGKFNGKLKRERRSIHVGEKIKLQNIAYNIKYSYKEAYTFAGVFGIKVWFSF